MSRVDELVDRARARLPHRPTPAELVDLRNTVRVQKAWSDGVGKVKPKLRHGLGVATDGERAYVASFGGDVQAYNLKTGRQAWRAKTRLPLTGGPAVGQGVVVVGASHGDLVALDAATGAERWKSRVNSELLSAAAIDRDRVVLRAVDGRVIALDLADGKPIWSAEQAVPRLSLRGAATPTISGDIALSGFDNGRLLALNLRDGSTAWEATVAPPSGRTELERLIDIDSALKVAEDDVFAVTYQGRVARLARDTGQVWWTRDLSSYRGLDVDAESVYVSTAEGQVVKMGRRTGVEVWRQEALGRRRLSAPTVVGPYVAVGDYEGYVHFLSADSGQMVARLRAGDGRIAAPLVPVGDLLLVFNDSGVVTALRVPQAPPPAAAPTPAPAAE